METTSLPANCHMGSDGRPHHEFGFSFMATVEKCPGARRSHKSAANLIQAGERGVALHLLIEGLAQEWSNQVGAGKSQPLIDIFEAAVRANKFKGVAMSDIESVRRTVVELNPFFQPEPGMLFGTEEMIELRDSEGVVISLGYYDIFLKIGKTVLLVDNKFVRKEVEAAERNRQGHCLTVAVWQTYADAEDVIVLFCMPDLESSMHRFNRTEDEQRLTQELENIVLLADQPFKTLQAGDHCVYCKFRADCPAAIGTAKTMVTGINPLAVPAAWSPQLIKTAEDMAILRYWGDTLEPIIAAIKEESVKWAQNNQPVSAVVNGQLIEYKVQSRSLPRQLGETIKIWEEVQSWMPVEAILSAAKLSVTSLEGVVVALISDRLIAEGKEPNAKKIAADFTAMLQSKELLTREEGRTFFLKRVKASVRKQKGELPEVAEEVPAAES